MDIPGKVTTSEVSMPTHMNGGLTTNGLPSTLADSSTTTTKIEENGTLKPLRELDASFIPKTLTQSLRPVPEGGSPELWSFSACSDHMVTAKWTVDNGWEAPQLKPYGDLAISPAASCLHYATQCFEGMKAFRGHDGKLRLFRPDLNCKRMLSSAARISLPTFDPKELEKMVVELMKVDGARWLPRDKPGNFIYIRPTLIGNGTQLGVQVPQEALLYVIAVPWPDFTLWKNRTTPANRGLKLLASNPTSIRAWPGGVGHTKVGANYGPALKENSKCQALGHDQILWLFGDEGVVTEAGASNFFIIWKNKVSGRKELVTATLDDHITLPGVMRRSVLQLVGERLGGDEGLDVVERRFTIGEIEEAWREGRLVEAFVSGTAFFITSITNIQVNDTNIILPTIPEGKTSYAATIKKWLADIQYGGEEHPWGAVIPEDQE